MLPEIIGGDCRGENMAISGSEYLVSTKKSGLKGRNHKCMQFKKKVNMDKVDFHNLKAHNIVLLLHIYKVNDF
jgi:hypothetical protein